MMYLLLVFQLHIQGLAYLLHKEIIKLFRLEKTFQIIESNQKLNPAKSTTKPFSVLILLAQWFKCSWSARSLYFLFFVVVVVLGLWNTNKIKFQLLNLTVCDRWAGIWFDIGILN